MWPTEPTHLLIVIDQRTITTVETLQLLGELEPQLMALTSTTMIRTSKRQSASMRKSWRRRLRKNISKRLNMKKSSKRRRRRSIRTAREVSCRSSVSFPSIPDITDLLMD
jgi:hypothetical protein